MANTGTQDVVVSVPYVIGAGSTPTLSMGAAAGTGATSSIVGTNMSGKITLNVGTGILSAGTVMTMTFAGGLTYPSGAVVTFSAGNDNFAAIAALVYATTSTTTVTLACRAALTISTTYIGYYTVTGY
jgi:hypothetical protein